VPELVTVDWNMPVMDGLQFVSAVRSNPPGRAMTIMMVTSESEHTQIVRALAAGAHEYVIKPFTADALRDKLALLGLLPRRSSCEHRRHRRGVAADGETRPSSPTDRRGDRPVDRRGRLDRPGRRGRVPGPAARRAPADACQLGRRRRPVDRHRRPHHRRGTAEALTRALLGEHAPAELEDEDIADAFGEIANVVGGNVKAVLPGRPP
jgi:CheY-like chemotaxis protein